MPTTELTTTDRAARFSQLLAGMAHGAIDREATGELAVLVRAMLTEAMRGGGKPKGKLVLTINLQLVGGAFDAYASVKRVDPAKVQERIVLYGDDSGHLSENDLRQGRLFDDHKDVSTGAAAEIKDIRDVRSAAANDR